MNAKMCALTVGLSFCWVMSGLGGEGSQAAKSVVGEPVEVELFAAARSGQLQVTVVPQSYLLLTLRIRNNTLGALRVLLPETFAAIPTARWQTQQMLQKNGRPPRQAHNYGPYQGGSQGLGGSLAGQVANGQKPADSQAGDDKTPRVWSLAPSQLIQVQVPCFCLEFGKPDPNRHMSYQLVELQDLNDQPAVQELLKRFGQGDLDQRIAQLAAWHVANGTPWHVLAQVKFPRSSGRGGSGVLPHDLQTAKQLAESLPSYRQQSSLGER